MNNFQIPIFDYYAIENNKNGSGLALTFYRGILCEGHIQSYTSHCQFDQKAVETVIVRDKEEFSKSIQTFIDTP